MNDHLANFKEKCKTLPVSPGVYMMKNLVGEVIYVGKAKNLKNRVKSYFQGFTQMAIKTQKLVVEIRSFDITIVDTET
ncbi:MAG: GIY-YIG nuclease family protein, partial [Proteobacteria bacterium]|nr:GIY-YIG nuclease family protein [Pseudomonadota bacterium]